MKKLNALLHDVTVVNFHMLFKLVKRYKLATICMSLVGVALMSYLYFGQQVIYQKQAYFKIYNRMNEKGKVDVLTEVIDARLGTNSYLKKPEVQAIVGTYNFLNVFAEDLVTSGEFSKLDFTNPLNNDSKVNTLLRSCADKVCKIKTLVKVLPTMFVIEPENGTNRMSLTVTSRSKLTAQELLRTFETALEKVKHDQAVAAIDQQIKKTQDLISKTRSDIETKGGMDKVANNEFLEALILQQRDRVRDIGEKLNYENDQFHFHKIRLKQSHTTANIDVDIKDKLGYDKFAKLRRKLEDLRTNISSISSILPESRSETDEQVLEELKREVKVVESELAAIGKVSRNIAFDDNFINKQIDNQSTFEFDFKVASAKLKSLQAEYDSAKQELDQLFSRKAAMENEFVALKPDLEYLKILEEKLISMKIKKSAMASEVEFDPYGPEVLSFKRNALWQIFAFSLILSGFFLSILLVILYLRDDRIYDEQELRKVFDDLPVIGKTPNFD